MQILTHEGSAADHPTMGVHLNLSKDHGINFIVFGCLSYSSEHIQ